MRRNRHPLHANPIAHSAWDRSCGRFVSRAYRTDGYTLLEVLLALTVLTILAAVGASPLINTWRDNRLGEAAEGVRSLLAGSRIQSLDRDETWEFRFEPGGTLFVRVPTTVADDGQQIEVAKSGRISGTLPEGIRFSQESSGQTMGTSPGSAVISPELFSGLPNAAELMQASWSEPVYFYSDGTADAVEFELTDQYGGVRRVSVRDLTGAVRVSKQSTL
jgi:prepilin-type N-terminal cleavage/methylation domain-containing protein